MVVGAQRKRQGWLLCSEGAAMAATSTDRTCSSLRPPTGINRLFIRPPALRCGVSALIPASTVHLARGVVTVPNVPGLRPNVTVILVNQIIRATVNV
jgi:hypothetical protein